jgi:glutathione S-transferase
VDIAYAPFVDGFKVFFAGIQNYDTTAGRPNIQRFVEVVNKQNIFLPSVAYF